MSESLCVNTENTLEIPSYDINSLYLDEALFTTEALKNHIGPICPISGIPLPIARSVAPDNQKDTWSDEHHAFFFRNAEELNGISGKVVRHSRLQRGPRWTHNRYHSFFPNGTFLPQTEYQKFVIGVLACAGLIPDKAVDVSGRKPKIVKISRRTHKLFQRTETIHPEKCWNSTLERDDYAKARGVFFITYSLANNFDDISEGMIEQFLEEKDYDSRIEKAGRIIGHTILNATEPILPIYKRADDGGLLSKNAPKGPAEVIKLAIKNQIPNYVEEVERFANLRIAA